MPVFLAQNLFLKDFGVNCFLLQSNAYIFHNPWFLNSTTRCLTFPFVVSGMQPPLLQFSEACDETEL